VASDFDEGLLIGLLIGEGHFGGDGRQPQVTLRMHVRHGALIRWIERTFPGGKVYGPYNHGGREYFQWMARGNYLREDLLPLLERHLSKALDEHSWSRFDKMRITYSKQLSIRAQDGSVVSEAGGAETGSGAPEPSKALSDNSKRADEAFEDLRRAREIERHNRSG